MKSEEQTALDNLTRAFGLTILPAFYTTYMPSNPRELGDWTYFVQKADPRYQYHPVGAWYHLVTLQLPQHHKIAFRDALRARFKETTGSVHMNGHEFCPTHIDNPAFPIPYKRKDDAEEIYIPGSIVEALVATGKQVPLQDIIQQYHDVTRQRVEFMNELGAHMNQAGGYPVWRAQYFHQEECFLIMDIPLVDRWGDKFEYATAKELIEAGLRESPCPAISSMNFEEQHHRDGADARIVIKAESDEDLAEAVRHLAGPLRPVLKKGIQEILLQANPRNVIGALDSDSFWTALLEMGPGSHSVTEVFTAAEKKPDIAARRTLHQLAEQYSHVRDMLRDVQLPEPIRAALIQALPALQPEDGNEQLLTKAEPQ